jgi:hypothetical protein
MSDVDFSNKPGREQLETYVGSVAWRAFETSRQAREAQVQVLSAKSPEQLAAAIAEIERQAAENAADWARLVDQIRSWS